ncbi:MAG: hypothetical protein MZV64_63295 [Ignavibacteriales bacterium]|nr:hypothetical protein [Ignavibacteriales bacterium]
MGYRKDRVGFGGRPLRRACWPSSAAQDAPAPKPLVRKDLLVLGRGEIAPPVRDIFRPRATAAPAAAVRPGGPAVKSGRRRPAADAGPGLRPEHQLHRDRSSPAAAVIGLVLRGGQTLDVGEGDEIAPGYKVVERHGRSHRRRRTERREKDVRQDKETGHEEDRPDPGPGPRRPGPCRTISLDYQQGLQAEMNKNYDEAIQSYQKAALAHPNESAYRLALVPGPGFGQRCTTSRRPGPWSPRTRRKRPRSATARPCSSIPRTSRPPGELQALLGPAREEGEERGEARGPGPAQGLRRAAQPELPQRGLPALHLPDPGPHRPASISSTTTTFRDTNLAIDLTGKDLQQAVNFLCVASKNFSRVIDERTVIIVPDNVQKRMQYELNAIKTFYLSNIDASDVQMRLTSLVKTQYKVPTIQVDKNLNTVTIRDTPQAVALAEKILRQWDKAKGEVLIDIEIMEVDRIQEKNLGIDLSQGALAGRPHPRERRRSTTASSSSRASTSATWPTTRSRVPTAIASDPGRRFGHQDHRPAQDPRPGRREAGVHRRPEGAHRQFDRSRPSPPAASRPSPSSTTTSRTSASPSR